MSRLAVAAPTGPPTRLFIYYLPHGMPVEHFDPAGTGATMNLSASGIGVLAAFEPYKKYLNVIRGVSMNNGASNHAAIRATLTGFAEGTANGVAVDSIDNTIATALGVTPFVVGARPYTPGAGFTSDSYLVQHGSWVRPTEDPAAAADAYFASLGAAPGAPMQVDESAFRNEALDLSAKELQNMMSSLSALTSETSKLKLHLEALQALKAGSSSNGGGAVSCSTRPTLPAVEAVRGKDPLEALNFALVLDGHLEAAAHAFLCGTARVITMQNMHVTSDLNMSFPGGPNFPQGHHDPISHSHDAMARTNFASCQKWFYQHLADKMLAVLNQPDPLDPSPAMRTVLDNSVVFICSEISDGAEHNSNASDVWIIDRERPTYLPLVMLGGGGGYLKTQQILDVPRMHTDVLATVAAAMGAPVSTIGGQSVSVIPELKA
ncbi:MAG TPA: DUF1552 domain-containing protein [Polyangiaceae bacterium]|jgi:hypothetical protein